MVLESFIAANGILLASRMVHTKVEKDKQMTDKILSEGIYHITTKENAEKIMESGHIRPSGNGISMGRKKCFFFAGAPDYNNICSNCASSAAKYEFTAIKVMPGKEELCKYRQRSLNDDAITYLGKCDLAEEKAKIVEMVLDLDEKGEIVSREKTEDELEKGIYKPSEELMNKLALSNNENYEMVKKLGGSYFKEFSVVAKKIQTIGKNILGKVFGTKPIMLNSAREIEEDTEQETYNSKDTCPGDEEVDFREELATKAKLYSDSRIHMDVKVEQEVTTQEKECLSKSI